MLYDGLEEGALRYLVSNQQIERFYFDSGLYGRDRCTKQRLVGGHLKCLLWFDDGFGCVKILIGPY